MKTNIIYLFSFLILISTSYACQSMNGISKKAVLLGLDRNSKAYEERLKQEASSSSKEPQQSLNNIYNFTWEPRHIFGLSSYNNSEGSEGPYWIYARQRNSSKPIIIQSLTKSRNGSSPANDTISVKTSSFFNESVEIEGISEELFMKILNASRHNSLHPGVSISTYSREIPARLLQEPELTAEEPTSKMGLLKPGESVVLTMQPPPTYHRDADGNIIEDEEDQKVNNDWGGNCIVDDWKRCYNITVIGNPSVTNPHPKPKEKLSRYFLLQLDCFSSDPDVAVDFPWLCLRNGWTVNRCHILCMSKCNRELLLTRKWDYYVLHEGSCKT